MSMSKHVRNWEIDPGWVIAINDHRVRIDPDCPKLKLEYPFHLGSGINIGGLGFGYKMAEGADLDLGPHRWLRVKDHKYGVIVKAGASLHNKVNIDRGSWRDTVVGPNARINTGVFIGHNVQIGRGCLINEGVSISGSSNIEDFVVIWKRACIEQHVTLKRGAIVGAFSHVRKGTVIGEYEVWFDDPDKGYAVFQRMRGEKDDPEEGATDEGTNCRGTP